MGGSPWVNILDTMLKLEMRSDPRLLVVARKMVEELASVCGFPEQECCAITLAINEGLSNIIRHAYHNRHDQMLELSCRGDEKGLEFTLVDHGEPVDPARVCARPLEEVKPGGLGTHI